MPARLRHRCLPLLALAALLAVPWAGGAARAADKKAANHAKKAADAAKHSREAEVLMQAYVLLAVADHDYKGHRGHAMHSVHEAYKVLEGVVMHEGTVQQKIKAKQEARSTAQAGAAAKHQKDHHEAQAASDAQLREAAGLIRQVLPSLATHKGKHALHHAEHALHEIEIALKVR